MIRLLELFIFSVYVLRKRVNEHHSEALSNAVLFASGILSFGAIPILIVSGRLIGVDDFARGFPGESFEMTVAIFLFGGMWIWLRALAKGYAEDDIENKINAHQFIRNRPEVIAFSPLIFTFISLIVFLLL